VEFDAPTDYKEPERIKKPEPMAVDPSEMMPEPLGFAVFKGEGVRLDGKQCKKSSVEQTVVRNPVSRSNYTGFQKGDIFIKKIKNFLLFRIMSEEYPIMNINLV
jgi:hypothetical protein